MAKQGYSIVTASAVALAAATTKSIQGVRGNAAFGVDLRRFEVGFDGVTASAVPVVVSLCYCTFATNPPGTNSTSRTPAQIYGRVATHGFTAASNWTVEPTVLTVLDEFLLTPNGGLLVVEFGSEKSYDSAFSEGFVLACNAPAIVNVRSSMVFERC